MPSDAPSPREDNGEEDDDYMTMTFGETSTTKHESSLERRKRQKREVCIPYCFITKLIGEVWFLMAFLACILG
jgi:hypothetical protein